MADYLTLVNSAKRIGIRSDWIRTKRMRTCEFFQPRFLRTWSCNGKRIECRPRTKMFCLAASSLESVFDGVMSKPSFLKMRRRMILTRPVPPLSNIIGAKINISSGFPAAKTAAPIASPNILEPASPISTLLGSALYHR